MKIEAGKFYRAVDGERWGPARRVDDDKHPWMLADEVGSEYNFTNEGTFWAKEQSTCDLVEEVEPDDQTAARITLAIFTKKDADDLRLFAVVDGKTVQFVVSREVAASTATHLIEALVK